MLTKYEWNKKIYFDLDGIGNDGRIEGISVDELKELQQEIDSILFDEEFKDYDTMPEDK